MRAANQYDSFISILHGEATHATDPQHTSLKQRQSVTAFIGDATMIAVFSLL
jgi:hypothetical protein